MMPAKVLILAAPEDEHSKAVCRHLDQAGVQYRFWHKSFLFRQDTLSAKLKNGVFDFQVTDDTGSVLDFQSFSSVWFRRPGKISVDKPFHAPWVDRIIERESEQGLNGLLRSLECFMVNDPGRQYECLHKLWQLKTATDCGITIPNTLVTSCPREATSFIDSLNGNCIYKLIDELSIWEVPALERSGVIPTLSIRNEDRMNLDQVAFSLHLFQERIEKVCDIRLTIVGEELFAAEIDSQSGVGKTDFRLDAKAPVKEHKLGAELAAKVRKFMKTAGLQFACLDLALTEQGQYVFFEANPAGQFLWIEEASGMPIAETLARLLSSNSGPSK